jgi:hypothetical protein
MALSMASTGHKSLNDGFGGFTFGGKSYHRIAATFGAELALPGFAQIYILDSAAAVERRLDIFPPDAAKGRCLSRTILQQLHDVMLQHNHLVRTYRAAAHSGQDELTWRSCGSAQIDGMGLGAMIDGCGIRNVVIRRHGQAGLIQISDQHDLYHPLAYVLLFPTGSPGWSWYMERVNLDGTTKGRLSLHDWAKYSIMRRNPLPHLNACGQLTCEFWCDVWAQNEARKLGFLRLPQQQAKIRSATHCAVSDAISQQYNMNWVGDPVVMPTSFIGSARWYRALYHDAMMIPRYGLHSATHRIDLTTYHAYLRSTYGHPDLFVTMTCNPMWPEILRALPEGADVNDYPDIIARIFYIKALSLLDDLRKGQIFGQVLGVTWRVEWQFRGLNSDTVSDNFKSTC